MSSVPTKIAAAYTEDPSQVMILINCLGVLPDLQEENPAFRLLRAEPLVRLPITIDTDADVTVQAVKQLIDSRTNAWFDQHGAEWKKRVKLVVVGVEVLSNRLARTLLDVVLDDMPQAQLMSVHNQHQLEPITELTNFATESDAPLCINCGVKMRPAGEMYVCESCGSTSGGSIPPKNFWR